MAVRNGFLLPMGVVLALFRGKLWAAIRQGVAHGTRQLPQGTRRQPMEPRLTKLGRQQWNVQIRERSPSGQGELIYLARYRRGGPLSNRRWRACDGQPVVLAYEERAKGPGGRANARTMRWPREQCLGRFWLHVPPPRAVLVRGWGV